MEQAYYLEKMQFLRYVKVHKKDVWEIMQVTVLQMGRGDILEELSKTYPRQPMPKLHPLSVLPEVL